MATSTIERPVTFNSLGLNKTASILNAVKIDSTAEHSRLNLYFTGDGAFLVFAMDRRTSSSKPFAAICQKYSGTTNYSVLSDNISGFSTTNVSDGMILEMPNTYYTVCIIGNVSFTTGLSN